MLTSVCYPTTDREPPPHPIWLIHHFFLPFWSVYRLTLCYPQIGDIYPTPFDFIHAIVSSSTGAYMYLGWSLSVSPTTRFTVLYRDELISTGIRCVPEGNGERSVNGIGREPWKAASWQGRSHGLHLAYTPGTTNCISLYIYTQHRCTVYTYIYMQVLKETHYLMMQCASCGTHAGCCRMQIRAAYGFCFCFCFIC